MPRNLAKKSSKNSLFNSALRFLKYRPRSRSEIETHLSRKTHDQKAISAVIDQLIELKLINDQEFASWLVSSRFKQKKGEQFIRLQLKRFGIDPDIINQSLTVISQQQKVDSALAYLDKKRSQIAKQPKYYQKGKAKQLLYQRGFSSNISALAIDEFALGE